MKNLILQGTKKILPFCLLAVTALISCDKDEVIALDENDLYGDVLDLEDGPPSFSPETATQVLVDANGEITGYLDYDFNYRDTEGKLVSTSPTAANWQNPEARPMIFLYNRTNFSAGKWSGDMRAFFTNASGGINVNFNDFPNHRKPKSILIPPGCRAEFTWSRSDGSIYTTHSGSLSSRNPSYLKSLDTSTRSLARIQVTWDSSINLSNMLCGYASKSDGLKNGNLPIFYNTPISNQTLADITWDNTIRSYRSNKNGRCATIGDGVIFSANNYDKQGINTNIVFKEYNKTLNLGTSNTSSIIPDGDYYKRESDVGLSQNEQSYLKNRKNNYYQSGYNAYVQNARKNKNNLNTTSKFTAKERFCGFSKGVCQTYESKGAQFLWGHACIFIDGANLINAAVEAWTINEWENFVTEALSDTGMAAATYATELASAETVAEMEAVGRSAYLVAFGCVLWGLNELIEHSDNKSCDDVYTDCLNAN